jgi:glycosyltransferase involved in cell wall biosynthesis
LAFNALCRKQRDPWAEKMQMRVLFQDLGKKSGAQASYKILFETIAKEFPDDQYFIVCARDSFYSSLDALANVSIIPFRDGVLREWWRFWLHTIGIRRIIQQTKVDVIWTSNVGPYIRTGIPQILVVLNPFQVCSWSLVRNHPRSRFVVAALRWFFRRSLHCCDAVQVETALFGESVRRFSGSPQRIEVIAKAVESQEDFDQKPLSDAMLQWFDGGLGRSAFTFLYVAACSCHKNHAAVVAAMDLLRSRGITARVAFTITQEELSEVCDPKLVASLVKGGLVLPLGWINKEQLHSLYEACDACVMPSKSEQLSSAHLEAMHWKKPQVSADLPYAHDLCDSATLYADPDDPADWAAKMQTLIASRDQRERLVAEGLERMKTFPRSWREVARRQRAFLAEVANRG